MKPSPPYVVESDLERLEKIAREATPGPWMAKSDATVKSLEPGHWAVAEASPCRRREANAKHIATFDPPTILSLISAARKGQGIEGGSSQSQPCGASKHAAPEAEEPAAKLIQRHVAEALYYAFWQRNNWRDSTPFSRQSDAIRDMWIAIAGDAQAFIGTLSREASPLGAEPGSNANDRGREELKPLTKQPPIRERQAEGGETP